MKLTDHTYACNSLTNFEYEAHAITGNGNQNAESCFERLVKSHLDSERSFGGFEPFGTTVPPAILFGFVFSLWLPTVGHNTDWSQFCL